MKRKGTAPLAVSKQDGTAQIRACHNQRNLPEQLPPTCVQVPQTPRRAVDEGLCKQGGHLQVAAVGGVHLPQGIGVPDNIGAFTFQ
jgi:hypothetical protein